MLRPTKHSHPDRTVLSATLLLLKELRAKRVIQYSSLLAFVRANIAGGDALFLPAVNFLFLVGLIAYRPKTDSFEFLGPNEAF